MIAWLLSLLLLFQQPMGGGVHVPVNTNHLTFAQACSAYAAGAATSTLNIGSTGPCGAAANPVAGQFVFVYRYVGSSNAQSGTCTDSLGNSWTSVWNLTYHEIYCYSTLTTGGADTVTITTTSVTDGPNISMAFSNPNASPVDGSIELASITASTTWTFPSITTTNANDAIITCGGTNAGAFTFTAGSPFTIPTDGQVNSSTGGFSGMCEYDIVTSTGTYSPTATISTSESGQGITIAIKST